MAQEGYSVGDVNPKFVRGEVFVFFNQSTTLIDSCTVIVDPYTQAIQIPIAAYGQYNLSLDFSNVPGASFLWLLTNVQFSSIARQSFSHGYSTIDVNNLGINIPRLYYAGNFFFDNAVWLPGTYFWQF